MVEIYRSFEREGGPLLSASLAYHALFAVAPLLILAVSAAQFVVGSTLSAGGTRALLGESISEPLAGIIQDIIVGFVSTRSDPTYRVLSILALMWAVSAAVSKLQAAMNSMWRVRIHPETGLAVRIRMRIEGLVLIAAPSGGLIVYSTAAPLLRRFDSLGPLGGRALNLLTSLPAAMVAAAVAVFFVYRFLPAATVKTSDVLLPSSVVAIAWVLGTVLFGTYLETVGSRSLTGAVGTIFVFLVWMRYSAQALLLGASWCRERAGESVAPRRYAYVVPPSVPESLLRRQSQREA